jgi:hypothetical protein
MTLPVLLLEFKGYHLAEQMVEICFADYVHPICLDGTHHVAKEVCLLHRTQFTLLKVFCT